MLERRKEEKQRKEKENEEKKEKDQQGPAFVHLQFLSYSPPLYLFLFLFRSVF